MFDINYLIGFLTVLFSAIIQGITGFGFALIAFPLLSVFILPKEVVPIIVIYSSLINILMIYKIRKNLRFKEMRFLILSGIAGIPIGMYLLNILDPSIIKLIAGIIIIITSIALIKGLSIDYQNETLASVIAGGISGILNGSTSMSGPPIVLFFANRKMLKEDFRANLPFYGVITNLITIAGFLLNHTINSEVIKYVVYFIPAILTGVPAGIIIAKKINESLFRKLTMYLILAIGIYTIVNLIIRYF